jgi:hypothetical protein
VLGQSGRDPGLRAEAVVMDGLEPTSMMAAVGAARPEAIVHQMTAPVTVTDLRHFDRKFALTNRLRTEGPRLPARRGDQDRGPPPGSTGVQGVNQCAGRVAGEDETSPLDAHSFKGMGQSLDTFAELEKTVTTAAGINGLVLRYANCCGPGSVAVLDAVRQRKLR